MKKAYIAPNTKAFVMHANENVMVTTSIGVGTEGVNGNQALVHENNDWDIWDTEDASEE